MATKKEHKRKQKNKGSVREAEGGNPFLRTDVEINSLDLLSSVYNIPKAAVDKTIAADSPNSPEAKAEKTPDSAARREEENARRLEAEAMAERTRLAEEEQARAESERRRVEEARAADMARRQAEAAERQRLEEAETAERARKMAEEERIRRVAEEQARAEEERRRAEEAQAVDMARREAEEAKRRRDEAELERRRKEAEAAERARKMAEEAERARRMAEKVELARREAEETERIRREEVEAERVRQERAASNLAAKMAEDAARIRQMADRVALARQGENAPVEPAPPLEVDNPYWQRTPEVLTAVSGAPRGPEPNYLPPADAPSLPVTLAAAGVDRGAPPEARDMGAREQTGAAEGETVSVSPEKRMYIVMVTPEVAPCAKVGGLGDVILGLGRELMKRGHSVEVICPMYSSMRYDLISDLREEYGELWCPHHGEWRAEKVFQGQVGGLQVNFITGGGYTDRPSIYGFDDDLQRFTYFSRQALEFMYKTNRRPDIIHCHDWATGLVPAILWGIYEKLGWDDSRVVYTIHNNECQGLCGFGDKLLGLVGLDFKEYMRPDRMQDDVHKNCVNMMKAGIVYSNFTTTVSPTYAGELKTVAGGRGLQGTIAKNSAKIGGVLNGIDYDTWNPATDDKLSARYGAGDDFYEKYKNKAALREWLGMWEAWRPIISVVTRLTHQKGLDLIKHAIYSAARLQAQFVLLGSAPDPKVNAEFLRMQQELKDNRDINLYIGYHEDLSHLIYAGSDMFLVPSLYEPCGLTQMISLRYGTVPIVRETGGLMDTVFDLDNSGRGLGEANGFTFRDPSPVSLDYGLERAVRLWYDSPDAFNRLARNGMRQDCSWRLPAEHYENIFNYVKA